MTGDSSQGSDDNRQQATGTKPYMYVIFSSQFTIHFSCDPGRKGLKPYTIVQLYVTKSGERSSDSQRRRSE